MTKNLQRAALLLVTAFALAGCGGLFFAQAEEKSIAITHDFGGLPGTSHLGVPIAGPVDVPVQVALPPASSTFEADIPLTKNDPNGTIKVSTVITLNGADVAMKSTTGDLAGVDSAALKVFDPAVDPSGAQATVIATYTRPAGGAVDPTKLHFVRKGDVNLADYLANKQMGVMLAMTVQGAVNLPQQDWNADLTLDFYVKTRAEAP
ncbi:hypothetical protein [Anaeromyxobacter paludicola]|uniref:Lipoprotein n=1 Tax=Anaeromyxobacter paludicola TaxID=2918171 RepID=A0ABM7XFH6_9BACT|nr:hypothetical protein [Anaeromyxobacter paludicola]BDG10638.1 hypothetical protein AMPC_37510 [Anaeromyxobacter paludicola]